MDQSLEVVWDSFHSFNIFGVQIVKSTFLVKNIFGVNFYQIEAQMFSNRSR